MNRPSAAPSPSRREWIKLFAIGSVATLSGPRWFGSALAEVTSTGPGPAVIRLKVSDVKILVADEFGVMRPLAVLAAPGGSVQYGFNTGLPPFTLNRVAADRFVTLDSVCTHNGCAVGRYKAHIVGEDDSVEPPVPVFGNLMRCPCHGSRYDLEGRVFRDSSGASTEPAGRDLNRFATSYDADSDMVSITIPGLALHVRSISVHHRGPGTMIRLELVVPVTAYSSYEIQYRSDLEGPFTRTMFSTTASGPANQSVLTSTSDGDFKVYVDTDAMTGFFAVGLILEDIPE